MLSGAVVPLTRLTVATSRQIAESAQRVARVSGETASAARHGDDTIQRTQVSVGSIKRQVDVIVDHMIRIRPDKSMRNMSRT